MSSIQKLGSTVVTDSKQSAQFKPKSQVKSQEDVLEQAPSRGASKPVSPWRGLLSPKKALGLAATALAASRLRGALAQDFPSNSATLTLEGPDGGLVAFTTTQTCYGLGEGGYGDYEGEDGYGYDDEEPCPMDSDALQSINAAFADMVAEPCELEIVDNSATTNVTMIDDSSAIDPFLDESIVPEGLQTTLQLSAEHIANSTTATCVTDTLVANEIGVQNQIYPPTPPSPPSPGADTGTSSHHYGAVIAGSVIAAAGITGGVIGCVLLRRNRDLAYERT